MESSLTDIIELLSKDILGDITETEKAEIEKWLAMSDENKQVYSRLTEPGKLMSRYGIYQEFEKMKIFPIVKRRNKKTIKILKISVIAAASITIFAGLWQLLPLATEKKSDAKDEIPTFLLGADNKAALILSTGEVIKIEEQSGHINDRNMVIENDGRQLVYGSHVNAEQKSRTIQYNTLKVPVGSTFNLILADGSRIVLNSQTEIRYPVLFESDKREVYLNGEAYFDITKDTEKPFIVHCPAQTITVLGTCFNVEAYSHEKNAVTALIKGKVHIESGQSKVVIYPGIVAVADGSDIHTMVADTDFYTSWIDNRFSFQNESLAAILQKFERWYNIKFDVENADTLKGKYFTGYIPRYKEIDPLLEVLELSMNIEISKEGYRVKVKL